MKILIDIGHPGHVHLFRPFAEEMIAKGNKVLFTCREKEFEKELLQSAGFNYVSFGKKYKTTAGKLFGLIKFDLQALFQGMLFRPDIFMSHGSPYAAHAAWLLRKPNISLEDTGNMEQVKLYLPFTHHVLTPTSFHKDLGPKQIRYHGYHELAYLHPKRFTPDKTIYDLLKIKEQEKYVLLRFVSWNASHDVKQSGLSDQEKRELIVLLEKKFRVFISSEKTLPIEFARYAIKIPPEQMHQVMASAKLFIGEGATMASECAMLGVPAIYINTLTAGTISEQMNYGLVYHFTKTNGFLEKVSELLEDKQLSVKHQERKERMLSEKIDVTAFLLWFVENYPESANIMKRNPDYDTNFK